MIEASLGKVMDGCLTIWKVLHSAIVVVTQAHMLHIQEDTDIDRHILTTPLYLFHIALMWIGVGITR